MKNNKKMLITKIKDNKNKILIVLIFLVLILIITMGVSFGRYIYNINGNVKASVATPILTIEEGEPFLINNTNKEGEYNFIVKNYNDTGITDVALNYYIEILSQEDVQIEYELYKEGEKISIENKKMQNETLSNNNKEEHKYTLKVKYQEGDQIQTDLLQDVQIKVHSEQVELTV